MSDMLGDVHPTMQFSWPDLSDKRVLLAVSGGIAAYKCAELVRLYARCGADVQVMMTRAAQQFVGVATFAALSGKRVATALFDPEQEASIGHIELADQADVLVVAPATANTLAAFAHGTASEIVSTVYLAFTGPVLLAPAMNVNMWAHPATQSNIETLRSRARHHVVGPESGQMACAHVGAGRMSEPETILQATAAALSPGDLRGRRVLVSAGGTREAIDAVRFFGNRSTGKMGYAIAQAAASRGAQVTLVSGPSQLAAPYGVDLVRVQSAQQMGAALFERAETSDAIVMAAAVADFRPAEPATHKLKKEGRADLTLELLRTVDILKTLAERRGDAKRPLLVGFAAETPTAEQSLLDFARQKLARKGCDYLVANDVSAEASGFASDQNQVVWLSKDGSEPLPMMSKRAVGEQICQRLADALAQRSGDAPA
jgi:phosphopantothenoylcysteine decarboxylase/phosphopantothenate--cysteine ligase